MKKGGIFHWEFPEGRHPAVIVSHAARIAAKSMVNVLLGSSQRSRRAAEINLLYDVRKSDLAEWRGSVSPILGWQIMQRILSSFG